MPSPLKNLSIELAALLPATIASMIVPGAFETSPPANIPDKLVSLSGRKPLAFRRRL
jgi:hypothetical protein